MKEREPEMKEKEPKIKKIEQGMEEKEPGIKIKKMEPGMKEKESEIKEKESGVRWAEQQEQQAYAYWLECVRGLGRKSRWELVKRAGSPKAAYGMDIEEWRMFLPEKKAEALEKEREKYSADRLLERYQEFQKGEIRYVSGIHPDYPERLKKIPDPPFGIFLLGEMPRNEMPSVAVIGARECSEYGKYVAERAARELAERGISVISGMARGIDGISQWAAICAGGKSYAVLGSGADVCYPAENRRLYEELKIRGGILSEYPPGTQPQAGLFPQRNRIISGLADVVLIVEARERSGTLITADMALEQGKEVYAVPGRLTDPLSRGCNRLVKQGAGVMVSIEEMMGETGLAGRTIHERGKEKGTTGICKNVYQYLDFYPKSTEQLQLESGMEYRDIVCELMELCADNQAKQVSAGQYIKQGELPSP